MDTACGRLVVLGTPRSRGRDTGVGSFLLLALLTLMQQPMITRNTKIAIGMMKMGVLLPVLMSRREKVGWDASNMDHMGESKARLTRTGAMADDWM
jgi:hypothetical protein